MTQMPPWICLLHQYLQNFGTSDATNRPTSKSHVNTQIEYNRIVGGSRAKISEVPYQLSLEISSRHFCGATIISGYWSLSAAHCFQQYFPTNRMLIRSGTEEAVYSGRTHRIEYIYMHPEFKINSSPPNYDIATIKVRSEIWYIRGEQEPIPLIPEGVEIPPGTMCIISGWGLLQEGDYYLPRYLYKAYVPILSHKDCNKNMDVPIGQLCAGYWYGGIDACQGDSGGPLVVNNQLAGIVSWGIGCARPNYPGVYTGVSHYRKWIQRNTGV